LAKDAPAYAVKTAEVVQRLEAAMETDGRSARRLSLDADIDPGTLSRLRSGQAIPDLGTLVGLENALGRPLWCSTCAQGADA
jgi:transcriptional regulator with XRE-family HTH domain